MDKFYTTTAIDYVNGAPHIGHAYEKILTDVIFRHFSQRCNKSFFLTYVHKIFKHFVDYLYKSWYNYIKYIPNYFKETF